MNSYEHLQLGGLEFVKYEHATLFISYNAATKRYKNVSFIRLRLTESNQADVIEEIDKLGNLNCIIIVTNPEVPRSEELRTALTTSNLPYIYAIEDNITEQLLPDPTNPFYQPILTYRVIDGSKTSELFATKMIGFLDEGVATEEI